VAWPGNERRARDLSLPTLRALSNIPAGILGRKPTHEKRFSPRLSIAAADSSRKSAKRRRSGLSCRANQTLKEFSYRPPIFSGKPIPGGIGGKAGPDRACFDKDCVGRLTERDGWSSVMSTSFK
jgi:hypothetical protein